MAYQTKPNSGSLFENRDKKSDNHADRTGSAELVCPHCATHFAVWVNGWLKNSPSAGRWLSLSIRPKTVAGDGGGRFQPKQQSPIRDEDVPGFSAQDSDEVPF